MRHGHPCLGHRLVPTTSPPRRPLDDEFPLKVIGRVSAYLPKAVQTTFENLGADRAGRTPRMVQTSCLKVFPIDSSARPMALAIEISDTANAPAPIFQG